jgi:hypothetical protein
MQARSMGRTAVAEPSRRCDPAAPHAPDGVIQVAKSPQDDHTSPPSGTLSALNSGLTFDHSRPYHGLRWGKRGETVGCADTAQRIA